MLSVPIPQLENVSSESALPFASTILHLTRYNEQWIGSAVCMEILYRFFAQRYNVRTKVHESRYL